MTTTMAAITPVTRTGIETAAPAVVAFDDADETYTAPVNEHAAAYPGESYTVARFGTQVIVRVGDRTATLGQAPRLEAARALFAECSCDPDGPAAPRPGDTLELYDLGEYITVAQSVRLPGDHARFQVTDTDGRTFNDLGAFGFFALRARPAA